MEGEFHMLNVPDNELFRIQELSLNDSQESSFGRSRHGHTLKPKKVSDDFFGSDNFLEVENIKKGTCVSVQMKSPPTTKVIKAKSDDVDARKESNGPLHATSNGYQDVTDDLELDDISALYKVNDKDVLLDAPLLLNADLESDFTQNSGTLDTDFNIDTGEENALLGTETSLEVSNLLQLITPLELNDSRNDTLDPISNSKPALKTYTNKRKCFNKQGVVESFALPDKPLFPLDNDQEHHVLIEPKRCKDLDVPCTSGMDINLQDKRLMNTPWKIASMNTDMNTSETLLEIKYADASDHRPEDDILATGNCNSDLVGSGNDTGEAVRETKVSPSNEKVTNKNVNDTNENNSKLKVDVVPFDSTLKTNNLSENTDDPISKQIELNKSKIESKKHSSKSKSKHKHKSHRRHHRHHKSKRHSDTSKLNGTSPVKKHKSSKKQRSHKRKSKPKNDQADISDEKACSQVKKTENSTDALIEVLMSSMENKEMIKSEEVISVTKQQCSTEKPLKSITTVEKQLKTECLKKLEETLLSKPNKVVGKIGQSSKDKKKKMSNVDIEMFDKPLFSIPDATIRQVPSNKSGFSRKLSKEIKRNSRSMGSNSLKAKDIRTRSDAKENIKESEDKSAETIKRSMQVTPEFALQEQISDTTKNDTSYMKDNQNTKSTTDDNKTNTEKLHIQSVEGNSEIITLADKKKLSGKQTKARKKGHKGNAPTTNKLNEGNVNTIIEANDAESIKVKDVSMIAHNIEPLEKLDSITHNEYDSSLSVDESLLELGMNPTNAIISNIQEPGTNMVNNSNSVEEDIFVLKNKAQEISIDNTGTLILCNNSITQTVMENNNVQVMDDSREQFRGVYENEESTSNNQEHIFHVKSNADFADSREFNSLHIHEVAKYLDDNIIPDVSNILRQDCNTKIIMKNETFDNELSEDKTINEENQYMYSNNEEDTSYIKFDVNNEEDLSVELNTLQEELVRLPETFMWDNGVPRTIALKQNDYLKIAEEEEASTSNQLKLSKIIDQLENDEFFDSESSNSCSIKFKEEFETKNEETLSVEIKFDEEKNLLLIHEGYNEVSETSTNLVLDKEAKETGENVAANIAAPPLKTTEVKKDESSKHTDTPQRRTKEKLKNNKKDLHRRLNGTGGKSKHNQEIPNLLLPKTRKKKIPLRFQHAAPEPRKELKVLLENQNLSEKSKKRNENNEKKLKSVKSQELFISPTKAKSSEDIQMPKGVTQGPGSAHLSLSESCIVNKSRSDRTAKDNISFDNKIKRAYKKLSESPSFSKESVSVKKGKQKLLKNELISKVAKQEDIPTKRKYTKRSFTESNAGVKVVVAKNKPDENKKLQKQKCDSVSKTSSIQPVLKHVKDKAVHKTENKDIMHKSTDKISSSDLKEIARENVTLIKNQHQQLIKRTSLENSIASQDMVELSNGKAQISRPCSAKEILKQRCRTTNRQRRATSVSCTGHHGIVAKIERARCSLCKVKQKFQENTSLQDLSRSNKQIPSVSASVLKQKTISHTEIVSAKKVDKVMPKGKSIGVTLDVLLELGSIKVEVGDLMWARVGNYPFWPCLITTDPLSNTFQKTIGVKYKIKPCYHVRFYADKGRRSWISSPRLMLYYTKNDLQEIHDGLSAQQALKLDLQPYIVKPNLKRTWEVAVSEADSMKAKTVKERLQFFSNLIECISNAKKRPSVAHVKLNCSLDYSVKTTISDKKQERSSSLPPLSGGSSTIVLKEDKVCFTSPLPKVTEVKSKDVSESLFNESLNCSIQDSSDNITLSDVNKPADQFDPEASTLEFDTLSKSSSSKLPPIKIQKMLKRQKRYNLFKGIPKYHVCQICTKPQEVLRCQGPCNEFFHEKCAKEVVIEKSGTISEDSEKVACSSHQERVGDDKAGDAMSSTCTIIENNGSCGNDNSDGKGSEHTNQKLKSMDYSIAEQIDLKMKELMSCQDNYTSDYTSADETPLSSATDYIDNGLNSLQFENSKKSEIDKSSIKQDNDDGADNDVFKCQYCTVDMAPPCFVCEKEVSPKDGTLRQKCSVNKCGRFYHPRCLTLWPQTQWSLIQTIRLNDKDLDKLYCPSHVCHSCSSDNPRARAARCRGSQVVRCLRCPAIYHSTNYCVPAGTYILSNSQIICPRHFEPPIKKKTGKKSNGVINASWCFICLVGGNLICCETCPTSVHSECVNANYLDDGSFICDDCETGRLPLYDEVVWAKFGVFRWWPAIILFPSEVPENIENIPHSKGEFVVKFFGTNDYNWIGRGKVFPFQDEDRKHSTAGKSRIDISYNKSLEEAATAFDLKMNFLAFREDLLKNGYKPPPYIRVKKNKPVGLVRVYDPNISNSTPCECTPSHPNPCGPDSDCLNRILSTECDPNICPAKEKCDNQRFEKRQYPLLTPFKTESRGWGLKTQVPISKGAFVIEYVGELINEREYQRRIRKMNDSKSEDYYFLTIDKDRIIDAGPKGNLARFMNHCCQPNCETQKWTVNGDTRVGLFATEDIPADTEVTFNYQLQSVGKEMKVCACGASNCSGFIGDKPKAVRDVRPLAVRPIVLHAMHIESQKKPKKISSIKRKRESSPLIIKSSDPCFICGKYGDVGACQKKRCTKFYHLECVDLMAWPQGKWTCPWHSCDTCDKRTIRCCIKCIKSYCPSHSESNIHYRPQLGYVCADHDPDMESHTALTQSSNSVKPSSGACNDIDVSLPSAGNSKENEGTYKPAPEESNLVSPVPNKKKDYKSFVHLLKDFEAGYSVVNDFKNLKHVAMPSKRKRDSQKKNINPRKRIRFPVDAEAGSSTWSPPSIVNTSTPNEINLSPPSKRLRSSKKVSSPRSRIKNLTKPISVVENKLPVRKPIKPRSEINQ